VVGGRGETGTISSFEDLDVYRKLVELHLEVHQATLEFPKYEMYELGSQVRRSSNSIPANLAEGWNNKHSNMYLEGINRALGELRETRHHLQMAFRKGHISEEIATSLLKRYDECGRMLRGLEQSVEQSIRKRTKPLEQS
jgi:four helix bundle protein